MPGLIPTEVVGNPGVLPTEVDGIPAGGRVLMPGRVPPPEVIGAPGTLGSPTSAPPDWIGPEGGRTTRGAN